MVVYKTMTSEHHTDETMFPVITFLLNQQYYALLVPNVVEVASMVELVAVPDKRPEVLGLANRHGKGLMVLDLRQIIGQDASVIDEWSLFIVAQYDKHMIGIVVDEVRQVEYVSLDRFDQSISSGNYVRGIISSEDRLIQIVAIDELVKNYSSNMITNDLLKVD